MLNYIWFGLMFISVVVGTLTGRIDAVTEAAIDMAKTAVEIAISLIGIMALWLGTMKIAEKSGLISIIVGSFAACFGLYAGNSNMAKKNKK